MRITTWNVNGIRAVVNKDGFAWLDEVKPDILCLQEIKAKPEQVPQLLLEHPEYQSFWHSAERPGYSGTAVLFKPEPLSIKTGLDMEEYDDEGRTICMEYPDFFLYNIYFPNGGQQNKRVPFKLGFYARLLELCDQHHARGEKVIITGDFNTAHNEIDLANPKSNQKTQASYLRNAPGLISSLSTILSMPIAPSTQTKSATPGGITAPMPVRETSAGGWITFWSALS